MSRRSDQKVQQTEDCGKTGVEACAESMHDANTTRATRRAEYPIRAAACACVRVKQVALLLPAWS